MTRRGGRLMPWLLALAGYVCLTLIYTWPLPVHLTSVVPHDAGDPLLTAWILAWNAHHIPATAQWWNAPMFWPMTGVLMLSEHMLGISLVASPLQWLGVDPIAAYNVVFLLSFPLCAIAAHALAYSVIERHDAAALAGMVFAFNSYRASQVSHLHVLWSFWMPLALMALHRYARDGRGLWLVLFAAMWVGQALSNGYFLLFFPLLIGLWLAWFLAATPRRLAAAATSWAIGAMLLLPLVWPYSHLSDRFALERRMEEVRLFSADVSALAAPSPLVPVAALLPSVENAELRLFPGVTIVVVILAAAFVSARRVSSSKRWSLALAACASVASFALASALVAWLSGPWRLGVGGHTLVSVTAIAKPITVVVWCLILAIAASHSFGRARAERSAFAFYVGAAIVMYVFSFGPEPTVLGRHFWYKPPYAWLMEFPGYSNVRAPARFAMLAELCLSVAAAIGLDRIRQRLPSRFAPTLALVALAGAIGDGWVPRLPLANLPPRIPALESLREGTVVELPLGTVSGDIAALYRSIYHHRPVVNGYSGFAPVHYLVLSVALASGGTDGLEAVTGGGPLTVVDAQGRLTTIPATPEDPLPVGRRLRIDSALIDDRPIDISAITDGDRLSRWVSPSPQRGDEAITVDLGSIQDVDGIALSIGPYFSEYPRVLAIDTSEDGHVWMSQWSGRGAAKAIAGALRDPAWVPLAVGFPFTRARWIRLRQLGTDPPFCWVIAELTVFGR
jgi:hypothetical protein